jgi:hypothetical protein
MADHSKPTLTSAYADFVAELDARLDDLACGLDPAVTTANNVPTNATRWSSAAAKWQKYNGSAWIDLAATYAISISGNAGTVTNGVYTNGSYSDPTWITTLAGSKISGAITGNAASATVLQTARNINGVSFNGSANISINLNNNLTFNSTGSGSASGVNFNGGTATTISYNTIGAPSATGAGASGTWGISISGNAATVTNGLYSSASYADPAWITSLAGAKITGTVANATNAVTASNGGVTSVNGSTGAVLVSQGVPSAAFTSGSNVSIPTGSWTTIAMSTLVTTNVGATLSSGSMTLPAGTYYYETNVPVRCTGSDTSQGARTALYNDATLVAGGATAYVGDWSTSSLHAIGSFTLTSTTTLTLKVYTGDSPDLYVDAIGGYVSAWAKFSKIN